jgi:hypothetical protein
VSDPKKTGTGAGEELVPTPAGAARLDWFPTRGQPRAVALLGHGAATGVEAADLALPTTSYGVGCKSAEPDVAEQPVLCPRTSKVSPVACHAVPGPVSGGYAPYLSWWRSQLSSGPSLRPDGCSQSSCRPRAVRSSHW